ncbi:hypothetical protein CFC21_098741 [Triticum aestivum]|uniref:NB-ARC domain-containing protein n=2 Tax=Triticum aestivum TaxID=4565 RepID=A0A9R1N146_WHEAT|nr:hypothetical protein CFC21_098741 [Triticum aestivum]
MAPVVSATLGALGPLLVKLGGLLAGEYGRLKGVRREYTKLEDPSGQVKAWISLVRELAYDTEDIFDKFIHHLGKRGHRGGFKDFLRKITLPLKTLGARHEIADQIDDLKDRIKQLKKHEIANQIDDLKDRIKQVKKLKDSYKLNDAPSSTTRHTAVDPRLHALFAEEAHLVGMDGPRDDLAKWMVEEENNSSKPRKVLSIYGFGGLGKTTLANEVYRKIQGQFYCKAFVSVSQKPDIKKIMKDVISQVSCQDGYTKDSSDWDEMKSIAKLKELLQNKRYLIIIDDVWSTQAWNTIKCAFPENNCLSGIIVTSRIIGVAKSCCSGGDDCMYKLEALSDFHSRRLFFKRMFGSEEYCPSMLEEVSNKILKKCGGLPLAIISIAGLLANRPAIKEEWEKVKRSIGSALQKGRSLEGMCSILSLSYNDLPPNLKTCLLYLSVFPQDYVIDRERLVRLWIGEGFIPEEPGQSRQEVAENYFYELIDKNIVQPVDIGCDGKVRACRVHGMMLEIIISKSAEDNFVTVVGEGQRSLVNRQGFIRRLSVQHISRELADALACMDLSHVRSLTVSSSACLNHFPSLDNFEALRVLDCEDCEGLAEFVMNGMGKLFKLKYLSLGGKIISKLPPAVTMLPGLAFAELSGTDIASLQPEPEIVMLHDLMETCLHELPLTRIVRLITLQHLLISSESWTQKRKWKIPVGIENMRDLLELSGFSVSSSSLGAVQHLGYLSSLTKLCIQLYDGGPEEDKRHEEALLSSLCKLGTWKLRYLWIHKLRGSLEFLNTWSPPPLSIEIFRISGDSWFTNIPKWIAPELTNLLHLEISLTELRQEGLRTLGNLPGLLHLKLSLVAEPVERITVEGVGFPNLKKFVIYSVAGSHIMFMEGAMPELEKLNVRLHVPLANKYGFYLGIQHLPCLEEVAVSFYEVAVAPFKIMAAAAAIRKEARVHPNCPTIDISGEFSENDGEISSDDGDLI